MYPAIITFVIVLFSTANALTVEEGCNIYKKNVTEVVYKCMGNDTNMMIQAFLQRQTSSDLICNNQKMISDLFLCIQDEFVGCLPYGKELMEILPNEEKMANGVSFICDNREKLLDNTCMKSTQLAHSQCLVTKLYSIKETIGGPTKENTKQILCSVFNAQKSCFELFHGDCTQEELALAYVAYGKLFQLEKCSGVSLIQAEPENKILLNLLRKLLLPKRPNNEKSFFEPAYEFLANEKN
ncbi:hypothetical protein Btru_043999 [Bulinus truncatus]|nr:hypothetical protein Btru_043999 [Bulinus truncatus]